MDVVVERSEEDRSSSSDSGSSNEDLADFVEANISIDGIQGYQFQPRQDSYSGETSESDGDGEKGKRQAEAEANAVAHLRNLNW